MDINKEVEQLLTDIECCIVGMGSFVPAQQEEIRTMILSYTQDICREQKARDFNFLVTLEDSEKVEDIGWLCCLCDTPDFKKQWDESPLLTDNK